MKLHHILAFLTLFALVIVLPGLAQPDLAQPDLAQPDLSSISSSAMSDDGDLANQERTSIATDRDVSTDAGSLAERGPFVATVAADGSSVDSFCHICDVLHDLCLVEGIFTPRQCVQQYRACVEDLCS